TAISVRTWYHVPICGSYASEVCTAYVRLQVKMHHVMQLFHEGRSNFMFHIGPCGVRHNRLHAVDQTFTVGRRSPSRRSEAWPSSTPARAARIGGVRGVVPPGDMVGSRARYD